MLLEDDGPELFATSHFSCLPCGKELADTKSTATSNVMSVSTLRNSNLGAETPAVVPGATTISPGAVYRMTQDKPDGVLLLGPDIPFGVPGCVNAAFASAGGDFDDTAQQRLGALLERLTNHDLTKPKVASVKLV